MSVVTGIVLLTYRKTVVKAEGKARCEALLHLCNAKR